MASQIKTELNILLNILPNVVPNVVPEVVNGKNFLVELGVVRFKWTIEDFKEFVDIGQTIISPSFNMETTDPLMKVRSFHLEIVNPRPIFNAQFPIFLVNETGGEILTKITLEDFGPQNLGYHNPPPYANVCLVSGGVVHMPEGRKEFLAISQRGFPKEVTITIKVTLYQSAKKIVS
jgi:hypothetical protein